MSAWKNVRVVADDADGCRCSVPLAEWAEALATVPGVEAITLVRTRKALTPKQRRERGVCGCEMTWGLVERCSTCGERNPAAPASASTGEDGAT